VQVVVTRRLHQDSPGGNAAPPAVTAAPGAATANATANATGNATAVANADATVPSVNTTASSPAASAAGTFFRLPCHGIIRSYLSPLNGAI
jgi:hypothetical protein